MTNKVTRLIPRVIRRKYRHVKDEWSFSNNLEYSDWVTKRTRLQWHIFGYQIRLDFDKTIKEKS